LVRYAARNEDERRRKGVRGAKISRSRYDEYGARDRRLATCSVSASLAPDLVIESQLVLNGVSEAAVVQRGTEVAA